LLDVSWSIFVHIADAKFECAEIKWLQELVEDQRQGAIFELEEVCLVAGEQVNFITEPAAEASNISVDVLHIGATVMSLDCV